MNRRSMVSGTIALVAMLSGEAVRVAMAGTDGQAVAVAERQWLKSMQTNNVELLSPLLADHVLETEEDKFLEGKKAVLADAKTQQWSSAEYEDLKVTLFGRTAIATGVFVGKGTMAGKPLDIRVRFTDTWVKMANGKWLCVASHDSTLKT